MCGTQRELLIRTMWHARTSKHKKRDREMMKKNYFKREKSKNKVDKIVKSKINCFGWIESAWSCKALLMDKISIFGLSVCVCACMCESARAHCIFVVDVLYTGKLVVLRVPIIVSRYMFSSSSFPQICVPNEHDVCMCRWYKGRPKHLKSSQFDVFLFLRQFYFLHLVYLSCAINISCPFFL